MCLVKIAFDPTAGRTDVVGDVVDVDVTDDRVVVTTLFGERLTFDGLIVRRVDVTDATVHLTRRSSR